jgi:hypothetical protein
MRTLLGSVVSRFLLVGAGVLAGACGVASDDAPDVNADEITSNDGTALLFRFSGEVITRAGETPRKAIITQLQYVQGILTTDAKANGQTSMPTFTSDPVETLLDGDKKKIAYEVALPVVWPKNRTAPTEYELWLPRDTTAFMHFNSKYDGSCGRNEYGVDSFWHDFDPRAPGCTVDEADALRTVARVTPHPQATESMYPEYDKVWEDDTLDFLAVFGIISGNNEWDEGYRTRETLVSAVQGSLRDAERTEAPEAFGIIRHSTVTGTALVDGLERHVKLDAILVNEVAGAGRTFEQRYADLSAQADVIVYEGHSGLGRNINALARQTGATPGKYTLMYLYGCQTLGYLESHMHDRRIEANGAEADPDGTKFLDVITTALPAYGDSGRSTIALYRAMLDMQAPKHFNDLIRGISPRHLVVVFGEHDNEFRPVR